MIARKTKNSISRNQEFVYLIDSLDLEENYKSYLRCRWLQLFSWMDNAAVIHKALHYTMRLIMVVGGVSIPALVSSNNPEYRPLTFVVGLVVAICTAVDELFRYKDYWYHHRTNAELLRTEGWQFFQLVGSYEGYQIIKMRFVVLPKKLNL